MPTITVQIGQDNISIDPQQLSLKDLSSASTDLPFRLGGELAAFLNQPLLAVPSGSLTSLTLGQVNPSWNLGALPGNIPVTFSLSAGASASIKIQSEGPLFSYYVDFDQTLKQDVAGKAGAVYVVTEFSFNIKGGLSATAPVGSIGISASVQGATTYTVRNYKALAANVTLKDAILQSVAAFTLPLHSQTVTNLADGDAVYYTFDGSINVGFGATYGINASFGGYSLSEINSTFQKVGQVVDVSTKGITVAANAGLSLKFNWSRTFECFLARFKPDAGPGSAQLHISAGKTSGRSLTLSADGGITQVSAPQLTVNADTVTGWIVQKVAGNATPAGQAAFQSVVTQAKSEVQKYVDEANDWLSSLTQKVQAHGSISLAAIFESTTQFTSAFTWNFDLGNVNFAAAWRNAIGGDFVAALGTGAATLQAGSGYESLHTRNTKLTISLFGLAQFASVDAYFSKSALRYGDGRFYLETAAGRVSSSSSKSHSSSTSIYLEGTAESTQGAGPVSNIQIQLHGILTASGDKGQFAKMGRLAQALGLAFPGTDAGVQLVALGNALKGFAQQSAKPGSAIFHAIYAISALQTIQSDPYVNGKQSTPPHLLDKQNWDAYAAASDQIPSDPASYLSIWLPSSSFYKTYASWAAFNCLVNGYTDPTTGDPLPQLKTDRHSLAISQPAVLRQYFGPALSDTTCNQLSYYFSGGQQFMNLCDDLQTLLAQISSEEILDWDRITQKLESIAGNDLDSWFGPVAVSALARCVNPTAVIVQQSKIDPSASSLTAVVAIS